MSHHGKRQDKIDILAVIEKEVVSNINHFLNTLENTPEGNGSLLDNTLVLIGSNLGNASNHTHNNLPIMLVGGGIKHKQHVVLKGPQTPLCNLYLEILNHMGVKQDRFGSSTGSTNLFG